MRKQILIGCVAGLFSFGCHSVMAGMEGLEDDNNAKLARVKSKKNTSKNNDGGDSGDGNSSNSAVSSSGCNLSIGSVVQEKRKIGGKTEVNTFVQGPVVQANSKCK